MQNPAYRPAHRRTPRSGSLSRLLRRLWSAVVRPRKANVDRCCHPCRGPLTDRPASAYRFPDDVRQEIERLVELHLRIAARPPD